MTMQENIKRFEQRKKDHIHYALMAEHQSIEQNHLDKLQLIHEAIPDLDFHDIDISSQRLGQAVSKPFLVSSMTAGHAQAPKINRNLLEACSKNHWAMGVGSQRRELHDKTAAEEWRTLRRDFPAVALYGNLGIAQLITASISDVQRLAEALQAEAFIIHMNPLQECIQPEGTPQFKGAWAALEQLVLQSSLPIIVKETGCGFSMKTLSRLNNIGIAAVEISGLGGTHWGRIEGSRAKGNPKLEQTSVSFRNWGIDTLNCLLAASELSLNYELWGSGGVRNGLDAAKLIALGATNIGFAKIMLEAAVQNAEETHQLMNRIEYELKTALFCTDSANLSELKGKIAL